MGASFIDVVVGVLYSMVTGFTEGVSGVKTLLSTVLEVNYNAMSTVLRVVCNGIGVIGAILNCLGVIGYTILVCVLDFIFELKSFVVAFLYLLWKLLILLYSFLDVVFRTLESFAYFLWTGGKWTAVAVKVSAQTFTENGLSTWKYFVLSLKELTNSIIGGFTMVGQLGKEAAFLIIGGLSWCHEYFTGVIYYIDDNVRHMCRYMLDSIYHICMDYIPNLPHEVYLGILISFVLWFLIGRIFSHMGDRGLTFPFSSFGSTIVVDDDDVVLVYDDNDGRVAEFSDDDFIDLSQDESDNDSDFSGDSNEESDGDDATEVDDEEFEIDSSDSETESNAPSESERSEISIVLPQPDMDGRHNQSRSSTPARFVKDMSPSNLQRIIDDEKEKRKCVVCQDRSKSVLILPCRHMCLCVECGNHIARSQIRNRRVCPLCRTKIRTIMNVYV